MFIDRDGTLVIEPPVDYQLDAFEKLEFYPKVFRNLYFIRQKLDFEFVMVTNQDGLGTDSFPEDTFWPVHNLITSVITKTKVLNLTTSLSTGVSRKTMLLPASHAPVCSRAT